ncbi:SGNH/GDSL hydrolase family protein [Mesonia sp. MT50]|uniref:SGNH/GDSL hydrolase family protein n=1 Tax=Mesonia profundi TaxID=3070998 RepID=A0ABU0ZXB4_9FLAO|nr:SGNH/GDSL hydrolase family protein [Mesonia profundi]MDQ7916113.1 SGNH/GDSL hydrolase family protein [Mesonia profundi]
MMMKTNLFLVGFLLFLFSNHSSYAQQETAAISYLALGDSYTIGESVLESERWPMQLALRLEEDGMQIRQPNIIAKTGWRTDELLQAMQEQLGDKKYDLVSVLIGVNNQYQGVELSVYKKEFKEILEKAIPYGEQGKRSVFVLSIPDYGVTPFGKESDKKNISKEVRAYNKAARKIAKEMEVSFYDITPISKKAAQDLSLVAEDELHPSGKMYALWVEKIYTKIQQIVLR